ncbi:MAG: RnfABCDGE type electron transport complex subunit B [Pseudomonadota bacterium]|nr:RnfABCDGE type electron transport complex subunit B [Pseudomonadota bacterium]MEC8461203.1 RnfABCDGE type electron transport complex subunit B [Pseudomonadota bacterium]
MSSRDKRVDAVDKLLPQTQCQDCGYKGCRPYADALVNGDASIDLCKPGGQIVLERLAMYFDQDPAPYIQKVQKDYKPATVAVIDKSSCIGCVKCIKACPVDAIVGAPKFLHEVLEDRCSGCGLCVPVCPVDCMTLEKPMLLSEQAMNKRADKYRTWYQQRNQRLDDDQARKTAQFNKRVAEMSSG